MRISVFGLGYVGCVTSACFAYLGHNVIGVDIVESKVTAINSGKAPIKEKGLDRLIKTAVKVKKLVATTSTEFAITNSDISFICVGTPARIDGAIELKYIENVCKDIAKLIRNKKNHIIVIRSTILPGTVNKLVRIVERYSGKKNKIGFSIAVNPEFMREGSAVSDFFKPPFIIIGLDNRDIAKKIAKLYRKVNSKIFITRIDIAEMIKYVNNSFHALKIVFSNEIGTIAKKLGIDSKKLMSLFCQDTKLNLSSYYMMPGFAYGGSCLPKDLSAICNKARELDIEIPLLNAIQKSNNIHIKRAIDLIRSQGKKTIGILGISFKQNSDDIRGNPILVVIKELLSLGYKIKIFDKNIERDDISCILKSYRDSIYDLILEKDLKSHIKDIARCFSSLKDVLDSEIIVISTRDSSLNEILKRVDEDKILIDLQGVIDKKNIRAKYISLC